MSSVYVKIRSYSISLCSIAIHNVHELRDGTDSQGNTRFKFVAIKRPRRSYNTQHRFLAIRKHMVRGWWRWDNLRVCLQGGRLLLYSPNSKCFDRRGLSSSTKAGLSQLWSIRRDEQATNRALTPRDTICYSKETQQWNAISCTKFKF